MMANDVICFETETIMEVITQLSAVRVMLADYSRKLSKVDLYRTGADRGIGRISPIKLQLTGDSIAGRVNPELIRRVSLSMINTTDHVDALQRKLLKVCDLFLSNEKKLVAMYRQGNNEEALKGNPYWDKDRELSRILKKLRSVTPPNKLPSVQMYKLLMDNEIFKGVHNAFSVFTGNFTEITDSKIMRRSMDMAVPFLSQMFLLVSSGNYIASDMQYSFNSFFDGCTYNEYQPVTNESLKNLVMLGKNAGDYIAEDMDDRAAVLGTVLSVLELTGEVGDSVKPAGYVATAAGLADDLWNEATTTCNQILLLQSMDKEDVLARVEVYKQTNDPALILTAECFERLINASTVEQAMFMSGKTQLGFGEDVANAVLSTVSSMALDAALPGSGTITSIASGTADFAWNTGDIPEMSNNIKHAADTTGRIYDVYQKSLNKYETDPTQENLKKAMDAYEAYQNACADSMKSCDDFINNIKNSKMGKIVSHDLSTDWFSPNEYRENARAMNQYSKDYFA